jgi:hypothetical protein
MAAQETDVNRWRRWAGELRRRHGRRERTGPSRAMTLARRSIAISPYVFASRRTVVNLHTAIAVTWRPALLAAAPAAAPPVASPVLAFARPAWIAAASQVPGSADPSRADARPIGGAAPAFVPPPALRLARTPAVGRRDAGRPAVLVAAAWLSHVPARRWRARVVAPDADLPARLARRAVREELPVRARTTRLAPPAASATPATGATAGAPAPFVSPASLPAAPPPVIDVGAITSQVMQQIDRRLIAYRERMGRA